MQELTLSDGSGVIQRYADFPARTAEVRHIDVWCPPDISAASRRYPVIYMHDGQNLFDPATSLSSGIDWGIDEAILRLMQAGRMDGAIVVGIWHPTQRMREYMPQKPLELPENQMWLARFSELAGGPPVSDRYLRFIVEELKPFIDARYPTLPDQAHTFIMGSSMGSLISLYAIREYPQIFGGAGCVSTHWVAGENVLVNYFGAALPTPIDHKLYFDYGTETADAAYEPYQQRLDEHLAARGYERGKNWITQKFDGAEHSERAWRTRVHLPLEFLLGLT